MTSRSPSLRDIARRSQSQPQDPADAQPSRPPPSATRKPPAKTLAKAASRPLPRPISDRCRNGTWPTSIRRSTRPRSSATSSGPKPTASPSRQAYKGKLAELAAAPSRRRARRGGASATRRSTICSAGSAPTPGWSMPATPPIRRARSSTATCRSASPRRRCTCCSSRSSSTASTTPCSSGDGGSRARPLPAVDRGRAQGEAVSARGPRRAAVPREVGDRLFAPGTGCSTRRWRRCASRSTARSLAIEPTLNLLQDRDAKKRKAAAEALAQDLQGQPARLHAHHQHARQGQGDFRPLARLRRRRRRAASLQPGRAAKWSMRWSRRCAPPIRGCRTATTR